MEAPGGSSRCLLIQPGRPVCVCSGCVACSCYRVPCVAGALGRAYALLLASRGASVVVNDLGVPMAGAGQSKGPAEHVVQEIIAAGGKGEPVTHRDRTTATPVKSLRQDVWQRPLLPLTQLCPPCLLSVVVALCSRCELRQCAGRRQDRRGRFGRLRSHRHRHQQRGHPARRLVRQDDTGECELKQPTPINNACSTVPRVQCDEGCTGWMLARI